MKKTMALLLALMMAAAMVSSAVAGEKKTLTVVVWDATTTKYLAAQEAAYEALNPGVDIVYKDVASQNYSDDVAVMLAAGDTSDLVCVKDMPGLNNQILQGFLEPLDSYLNAAAYDLSGFLGMDENLKGADGMRYGLPFRSDFWVLYYNKTLFDAAGVAYPAGDMTWEAYVELAKKMTSGEGIDKVYGSHYHTWLSAAVDWAEAGGGWTLVDGNYEPLAYFYQIIRDLEDAGAVMEYSEVKAAGLHYKGAFQGGKIAMLPMGYWFVSTLINDRAQGIFDFDWSFTSVPHKEGVAPGSSFGNLTAYAINAKSAQKDLAWDYLAWVCGPEGSAVTAGTGTRPAWVSDDVAGVMSAVEGFPQDEGALAALVPASVVIEFPMHPKAKAIENILNEEHTLIMTRDIPIEEGVANMTERVTQLLAE